jgi:hypothetical protein
VIDDVRPSIQPVAQPRKARTVPRGLRPTAAGRGAFGVNFIRAINAHVSLLGVAGEPAPAGLVSALT